MILQEITRDDCLQILSGAGTDSQRKEWRLGGAAEVIAKPFRVDQLANLLGRLVQGVRPEMLASGDGCRE
jgi:hypothetical protein